MLDDNAREQAARAARLPLVAGLALMPDAHLGIGATIGSVIATENAIIPAAVGVDIGCGMIAIETSVTASDLPDSLDAFMPEVALSIPAGLGRGHAEVTVGAATWLTLNPHTGLDDRQRAIALHQFGSLGSGNHFFEVCIDERDLVWLVLHSGSRGIGNQLAQGHIKLARAQEQALEDPDLAYFLAGTDAFMAYVLDMYWAQDYALANRERMAYSVLTAFLAHVGTGQEVARINCHHNFAAREQHGGRWLWITRKGAIQALGGQYGVIPGSMGDCSYIVRGLGNEMAYNSAPHGAGRRMSRGQARREITEERLAGQMAGKSWLADAGKSLLDEAPDAYKPIDVVMRDAADLVEVVHRLHQVLNYKGVS